MHLEQQLARRSEAGFVILEMRAIGGPHLDQRGARAGHDVGDPECTADLHQLAARHDRLAAAGQGRERDQHGAGGVVQHHRVLGARQLHEEVSAQPVA